LSSTITGTSVTRAGGGGGYNGSGGSGGGGSYSGGNASVNTGSGGGGGVNYGGAGGSGICIVRQSVSSRLPTVLTGTPLTYVDSGFIVFQFNASGSIGWS
jgi:hypothetical protein